MDQMVELRGVAKRFGAFTAVAGVDLQIRAGEFLTLLGPSGCGKTTLLRMISGFETPTEGAVYLDGHDVTSLPPYRRNVNQVFQSYALFPHLSVWDNIAFGLQMKKSPATQMRDRVEQAIDTVALRGFEKRKPSQLSGGQKQRVALARAIVCEPKVLLLDEPLAALDAKLRRSMQIELKRLQTRLKMTFLFVTHDQEEALVMSDRIAVVNQGKIEQIGAAADIYHRPATAFVADFLGQANVISAEVLRKHDNIAEVKCKGGPCLHIDGGSVPDSSTTVTLCIRAEKIRLNGTLAQNEPNQFSCTVRDVIFRGTSRQLLLVTDDGLELTSITVGGQESSRPGDRVVCHVAADDVVTVQSAG